MRWTDKSGEGKKMEMTMPLLIVLHRAEEIRKLNHAR